MKVAIVACSGFKRLPAHIGSYRFYFEAEKAGRVPRPYFITGASAGAIASAAVSPWNDSNFEKITHTIINLKKSNIFSIRHLTELFGVLTLGESFLNFIPPLDYDFLKTRRGQIVFESGRSGISLLTKIGLFYELLKQPSIFSSEPLRRFLKEKLDFAGIWNSDIKLEIPAADLKSAQMVYFTNYLPEHRQISNRNDVLVDMTRGSASVVAFLQTISLGNCILDDAALLNSIPLDRAMQAGCDVIFILMHRPYLEPINFKNSKVTWVEELNRAMDLAIGRGTELTLQWHEKINQDLEMAEQMEEILNKIPASEKTARLRVLLEKFSASGLKKTKILPVWSDEPLPNLNFNKFDSASLKKSYDLGYQAMKKTLEKTGF